MPIPEGDVLIHCGDWTRGYGSAKDTEKFAHWVESQPHTHKLIVPGNHDHEDLFLTQGLLERAGAHMFGLGGTSHITIDGVRFDGAPWMPVSGYDPRFAFEREDDHRQKRWGLVEPCDVLVTHCPPQGIMDKSRRGTNLGCKHLLELVQTMKPRYHFFGHVHEGRGQEQHGDTMFVNAANATRQRFERDDDNGITHMSMSIRDAMVFDI